MKNGIILKLPANMGNFGILEKAIAHLGKIAGYSKNDLNSLIEACRELMENSVRHAYPDHDGQIEISLNYFEHGIRVDMRDWGMPMSKKQFKEFQKRKDTEHGFIRIDKLVDRFQYKNLGKNGKKFTLIKHAHRPSHLYFDRNCGKKPRIRKEHRKSLTIVTRDFKKGDEEAIASLIYKNYKLSYSKEDFYYPIKILEGQGKKFVSIVAEADGKIVGHFALLLRETSNIAEIGVVVVDPEYKGMGIMNKMFDHLLDKGRRIGLSAVYGEAVMYHIFSQKSNLSHHFCESALVLGHTPADYKIEGNKLTQRGRRGADLLAFRFFEQREVSLYLPKRYREQIIHSYNNCNRPHIINEPEKKKPGKYAHLNYRYKPVANIADIIIHRYGKDFEYKFILLLDQLRAKHCDMIYADINLEEIPQINKVVKFLNSRLFFYSGILFMAHHNQDYLRLQYKHSDSIGRKNLVCYSDYCRHLLEYIRKDEMDVKSSFRNKRKGFIAAK